MALLSARGQAGACSIAHSSRTKAVSRVVCRASAKGSVSPNSLATAVLLLCMKPLSAVANMQPIDAYLALLLLLSL
jgi:hypothetical protein